MGNEIIKVCENTWRIENGSVRFFLLAGTEKAALIDSGASCPEAKQIAESLTELPIMLINTHGDGDHVSGTGAFEEIYIHPADHERCRVGERFPDCRCVPLNDGDRIDLGGRVLEMIGIPGHTYGSVAILDVNNRALYSGDSVQGGHIFMFGKHRDPASFAASMDKLAAAKESYDVIYPSHGDAVLAADYVGKVRSEWQRVLDGEIIPHEQSLHGTTVKSYDGDACGFYCD